MKKKKPTKWYPVKGEKFYFIHETDVITSEDEKHHVDLNSGIFLVIGEAEAYEPSEDTKANCFRTKKAAQSALSKIKTALKFTGKY